MVGDSVYKLRNSRLKRNLEENDGYSIAQRTKRFRRSDSIAHKENNGPDSNGQYRVLRSRADPLKTIQTLNSIDEEKILTSTPARKGKELEKSLSFTRLTRSSSARSSPVVSKYLRLGKGRRRSAKSVRESELQICLERCLLENERSFHNVSKDNSRNTSMSLNIKSVENLSALSWFSPRRMNSTNKDQTVKLKQLNARRMEFDLTELSQSVCDSLNISSESILNHSITGDPLENLLKLCGQSEIKSFDDCFDSVTLDGLVKIGEGVYGEVFQSPKGHVIKVFPVGGGQFVNGEKQMKFEEAYPEVFMSKATVLQGKLPEMFVASWRKFKLRRGTDNECPDFLPPTQKWMILEFEFAGEPLADVRFNTYREARSVIEQIALSLAAAESALQFEHRDLHWHNVLVRPTRQWKLRYRVDGVGYSVFTEGIQVTIIDFTVSRLCHEGNIVYVDMSDSPEIFECEGDYQFDVYRMMRDFNRNNWRPFYPISNLYWLHYLMGKLLTETSYPRRDPDSRAVESELRTLHDIILAGDFQSVLQLVSSCFYFDSCRIG